MKKSFEELEKLQIEQLILYGKEYCDAIEHCEEYEFINLLNFLDILLPILYFHGSFVPFVDDCDLGYAERTVTEETYTIHYNKLTKIFNEHLKLDLSENEGIEKWINSFSISEYLCDIYQDIKDVVCLYDKNTYEAKKCAIHLAKIWFVERWGGELLRVLLAIHYLLFEKIYH
ncbi:MAG: DUF5063 domain-containing protein [Bacteroidales bacterium]|jgi:hypothetical protein|nr:DUF5063 domain-containing protein [Bacteroidales bacterium]MDI9574884.1 DUF5063 domain-containing protein [Bacteroidota bacterium]MDD2592811.1 DUF5063 domain-containing protein [Bacteroidales bacterium]MDD3756109.1 DUF5063 domain-containing protein [Bacteroidales bacterium]MDY0401315.1 DUF5063 domain-containing protein [Bacteroidales bacterium]